MKCTAFFFESFLKGYVTTLRDFKSLVSKNALSFFPAKRVNTILNHFAVLTKSSLHFNLLSFENSTFCDFKSLNFNLQSEFCALRRKNLWIKKVHVEFVFYYERKSKWKTFFAIIDKLQRQKLKLYMQRLFWVLGYQKVSN